MESVGIGSVIGTGKEAFDGCIVVDEYLVVLFNLEAGEPTLSESIGTQITAIPGKTVNNTIRLLRL